MYPSLEFTGIALPGHSDSFQISFSDSMKTGSVFWSIYHTLPSSYWFQEKKEIPFTHVQETVS